MGLAVASTTRGADGLELTDGKDLVIADDPRVFAEQVIKLLQDPERRHSLGGSLRDRVCAVYEWDTIYPQYREFVERVIATVSERS